MIISKVGKILTKNDSCDAQSHQAGISIPPIAFDSPVFPPMSATTMNPSVSLTFIDEYGNRWNFEYKYYNSTLFGVFNGHNEHRLTCTTAFVNNYRIHKGDEVWFAIDDRGNRYIGFKHKSSSTQDAEDAPNYTQNPITASGNLEAMKKVLQEDDENSDDVVIELSGKWKKVTYKH